MGGTTRRVTACSAVKRTEVERWRREGEKIYIYQNNGECGIPAQVWATSSLLMTFSFLHLSPEGSYQPCNSAELISRRVGGGWEEEEVLQGGGAGYLRAP